MTSPPTLVFPKLDAPVTVDPSDCFAAPAILDQAHGSAEARRVIRGGMLRPSDIEGAELGQAHLLHVPFWRVDLGVDGFHIGLSAVTVGKGRTVPLPTGGTRHKDAVVMVCARRLFPYEPKVANWFTNLANDAEPFIVNAGELALSSAVTMSGEVLDADVKRAEAEKDASRVLLRAVEPSSALYAKYEPMIRSATFCYCPVYYLRYGYEGEARRHPGEEFFVVVSARTGKPISAHHPSAVRAAAAKFRRLLTFR
jgi:hypothetical protein